MSYDLHPLCTLFPRLTGAEFDALRDDIKANGLREPIVLHDGMILDGGNRYAACVAAGVEPAFRPFAGENIVSFVLSANLHRRHMTPGQQAAIVAAAQDWAEAAKRGGDRRSDQSATLHFDPPAVRAVDRAAVSGASLRTQKMADKVSRADPELATKVAHGEVSLPQAVAQVEGKSKAPKKVAAAPDAAALEARIAELTERLDELAANNAELIADNESMAKVFEADDKLAAAAVEIKKLNAQVRVLRDRVNGLMNEKNEAVRIAKALQRKLAQLEKAAA